MMECRLSGVVLGSGYGALETLLARLYATAGVKSTRSYNVLSAYLERTPQGDVTDFQDEGNFNPPARGDPPHQPARQRALSRITVTGVGAGARNCRALRRGTQRRINRCCEACVYFAPLLGHLGGGWGVWSRQWPGLVSTDRRRACCPAIPA
jgi:hypothetical protein